MSNNLCSKEIVFLEVGIFRSVPTLGTDYSHGGNGTFLPGFLPVSSTSQKSKRRLAEWKCRVEGMKVPPIREKGGTYLFSYSILEDIKIMKNLAPCTPLTLHIFSAIDFGSTQKVVT